MNIRAISFTIALSLSFLITPLFQAQAHCDTLDGPVISAAKQALDTKNPNYVLVWVQPKDEAHIREMFQSTINDRNEATEHKFFEELVKVHREGEGAPYTGIKEHAEEDPAIMAVDQALKDGDSEKMVGLVTGAIGEALRKEFAELKEKQQYRVDDVDAGRTYVGHYVAFMHRVEAIYGMAEAKPQNHVEELDAHGEVAMASHVETQGVQNASHDDESNLWQWAPWMLTAIFAGTTMWFARRNNHKHAEKAAS